MEMSEQCVTSVTSVTLVIPDWFLWVVALYLVVCVLIAVGAVALKCLELRLVGLELGRGQEGG